MWALDSTIRCASAASGIGSRRSMIGRTSPSSISGQISSCTPRTMDAFCAKVRLRRCAPEEAGETAPTFDALATGLPKPGHDLAYGADFRARRGGA